MKVILKAAVNDNLKRSNCKIADQIFWGIKYFIIDIMFGEQGGFLDERKDRSQRY
jgi:hypothetical protein